MLKPNQTLNEIYNILIDNIKKCKETKVIDIKSLLAGVRFQEKLCSFINDFFVQKNIPITFGDPELKDNTLKLSLTDIKLINASDVKLILEITDNSGKIESKIQLKSETGVNLSELSEILKKSGVDENDVSLPPEYATLGIIDLYDFSLSIDGETEISNVSFKVKTKKGWQLPDLEKFIFSTSLDISVAYPLKSEKREISGEIKGKQSFGDKGSIALSVKLEKDYILELKCDDLDLNYIVEMCGGELPSVIPSAKASSDIKLKWVSEYKKWDVHFDMSAKCKWNIQDHDLDTVLKLNYDRANNKGEISYGADLKLTAYGALPVNDDIKFKNTEFCFEKKKESSKWTMDGGLTLELYETEFILKALLEVEDKYEKIKITSKKKEGNIPIPELEGVALKDFFFDLVLEEKKEKRSVTGDFKAALTIPKSGEFSVKSAVSKEKFTLDVNAEKIKLSALAEALKLDIPQAIPEIEVNSSFTTKKDKTGWSFDVSLDTKAIWEYEQDKLVTQAVLKLKSEAEKKERVTYGSFEFKTDNTFKIIDEFQLKKFNVSFSKDKKGKWKAGSDTTIQFFDKDFELGAEYKERTLKLSVDSLDSISLLPQVLTLAPSSVNLEISKPKDKKINWKLSSEGELECKDVFKIGGDLSIGTDGIKYSPKKSQATLLQNFSISPTDTISVEYTVDSFSVKKEKSNSEKSNRWRLEAETDLTIKGLPHFFDGLGITKGQKIKFSADTKGVELKFDGTLLDKSVSLPDIPLDESNKIELSHLGEFRFKFYDLDIKLGKEISVGIGMGVAAPDSLNNMFGVDDKGNPVRKYFVTSSVGTVDFYFKLGYILKTKSFGAEFQIQSSPFTMIKLEDLKGVNDAGDNKVWNCDFGEFGKLSFTVPSISLDTKGFGVKNCKASGLKSLGIPFTPIKELLTNIIHAQKEVVDLLPDKLPLSDIQVIDDKGHFIADDLIKRFEELKIEVPKEVRDVIGLITGEVDRLPADLREYFKSSIPDGFEVDISISMASIDIDVKVTDPVRMITPCMAGVIPVLQGITFRGFSLGMMFGGAMFKTNIDADFDQFDLVSLGAGLLIPKGSIIPVCHDFKKKTIINNLLMYIPIINISGVPVPIPIPVFYDKLGMEYKGIEGVGLQAHAEFSQPEFDILYLLKFLNSVKEFLTDPSKRLISIPENNDLEFKLNNCYLELPKYIINKENPEDRRYGGQGDFFKLPFGQTIIDVFNTFKFMKLSDLVNIIPKEFRHSQIKGNIDFLGWNFETDWDIDTLDQNKETQNSDGIYAHIHAVSTLSEIAKMEGEMTLYADNIKGFRTRYDFSGDLLQGNLFKAYMRGDIEIDTSQKIPKVILKDSSALEILSINVFNQNIDIEYNENGLRLNGDFKLFEENCLLYASGDMNGFFGKSDFNATGKIKVSVAGLKFLDFIGKISQNELSFTGNYLGSSLVFNVLKSEQERILLKGKLDILGATVDIEANVNSNNIKDSSFNYTYNLPNLIYVDARYTNNNVEFTPESMEIENSNGVFSTKYLGMEVMNGKMWVSNNSLSFMGELNFPAKDFAVGLFGEMKGSINENGVHYKGEGSFKLGALNLTGYKINISPKFFKAHGDFLGSSIDLFVKDEKNRFTIIEGGVSILACPLNMKISIDRQNINNNCVDIAYVMPNVLQLNGDMRPVGSRGKFNASLFGLNIISGDIWIEENGFGIKGDLRLGLINFSLGGSISSRGFYAVGSCSVGLPGLEITTTISFMNGAPGISVKSILGTVSGSICIYRGELSILFQFGKNYYWINSTIHISTQRPHDWPLNDVLSEHRMLNMSEISDRVSEKSSVEDILNYIVQNYNGENIDEMVKNVADKFCLDLSCYSAEFSYIPKESDEKSENWKIVFYNKARRTDFFNELNTMANSTNADNSIPDITKIEYGLKFENSKFSEVEVNTHFESEEHQHINTKVDVNEIHKSKDRILKTFNDREFSIS